MYQLIFKDRRTGKIVKWLKTMKSISMKGNIGMFSSDKLPMYRNPVIVFVPYYIMVLKMPFLVSTTSE